MTPLHKPRAVVEGRKLARMDKDEFSVVEDYLRRNQYPEGISKGDKANLRRKCKNLGKVTFEQNNLRQHLVHCFEQNCLQPFHHPMDPLQ